MVTRNTALEAVLYESMIDSDSDHQCISEMLAPGSSH